MSKLDHPSFDICCVIEKFKVCKELNDVLLEQYCEAYAEVSKLLYYFGTLFYFVTRDVEHKISDLRKLLKSDPINYKTVKQMADWEIKQNENVPTKKQKHFGCRTLLRLHRALLFVIELMEAMCNAPENEQLKHLARSTYDNTLAQYHPWPVRKAVGVAVYALPTREDLAQHITESQPYESNLCTREQCKIALTTSALPLMRSVYDIIQTIYTNYNMLNLP